MSNLWFNIRFGTYHWQWGPDGMSWKENPVQLSLRNTQPTNWKWFCVYCIFGKHI